MEEEQQSDKIEEVTTTTTIITESEEINNNSDNKEEKEEEEKVEEDITNNLETVQLDDAEITKVEQRQSMWIGSQPAKKEREVTRLSTLSNIRQSATDINNTTITTTPRGTTTTENDNNLEKSSSSENLCNTTPTSPSASTTPTATSSISSWWNGLSLKLRTPSPTNASSTTTTSTTTSSTTTSIITNNTTTTTQFIPTLLNNSNNEQQEEVEDQIFTHSAIDSATKIVREGYLNKQGHVRKNWLCRYFILTETSLEYYKDKGSTFLNRIPLADCTITMSEIEIKKSLCFKITHHPTKRPFYFFSNEKANTIEYERDSYEWIGSVQEVIDSLTQQNQSNANGRENLETASIVTETHKNYELVHCMSHALLFSLGKISAAQMTDLCIEDFQSSETFNINKEVSLSNTPSSSSANPSLSSSPLPESINNNNNNNSTVKSQFSYKFVDYSPKVFRKIRELANVNPADYMISLTQNTLTEEPTQGKSNSLFYFTSDKKLLIKTITATEFEQLKSILPNYYFHLLQNPDSLLIRYYGLHYISPSKMRNTYFVVMENIFTDIKMDEIYDLKGSTLQRKAQEGKRVLMDLDFCTRIFISEEMKFKFFKQIESDCSFLERNLLMDYSLLLGIHYLKGGKKIDEKEILDRKTSLFKRYQSGMIATTADGDFYDKIYYVGIIDILTVYNIKKQIEHTYKSVAYDTADSMSAVDPSTYSKRFQKFMQKITGWNKSNINSPSSINTSTSSTNSNNE